MTEQFTLSLFHQELTYALALLILTPLWYRYYYYYLPFIDKDLEIQKS